MWVMIWWWMWVRTPPHTVCCTWWLSLSGETIKRWNPPRLHSPFHWKKCEPTYRQFIYVTSRNGLPECSHQQPRLCICVEKGLQVESAFKGHNTSAWSWMNWQGLHRMNCGGAPCRWTWEPLLLSSMLSGKGESINDIMEETCGAGLTMNYFVPGGCNAGLASQFSTQVKRIHQAV